MSLEEMAQWDSQYRQEELYKGYLPQYGGIFYERLSKKIRDELAKKDVRRYILDVGCSDFECWPEDIKNQSNANIVGLDISKMALSRFKSRIGRSQRPHAVLGIAKNLPFKGKSFDEVVCIETIKHTNNYYKEVLEELKRVLKKEGRMTLTFQHKDYAEKSGFKIKDNLAVDMGTLTSVSVFNEQDVKKLIEGRGLVIKEMATYTTKDLDDKGFPPETKDIIYVECKKV